MTKYDGEFKILAHRCNELHVALQELVEAAEPHSHDYGGGNLAAAIERAEDILARASNPWVSWGPTVTVQPQEQQ